MCGKGVLHFGQTSAKCANIEHMLRHSATCFLVSLKEGAVDRWEEDSCQHQPKCQITASSSYLSHKRKQPIDAHHTPCWPRRFTPLIRNGGGGLDQKVGVIYIGGAVSHFSVIVDCQLMLCTYRAITQLSSPTS
jgi:hypothetical protein